MKKKKKTEISETYNELCSYKYYGHARDCHGALFSRPLVYPFFLRLKKGLMEINI